MIVFIYIVLLLHNDNASACNYNSIECFKCKSSGEKLDYNEPMRDNCFDNAIPIYKQVGCSRDCYLFLGYQIPKSVVGLYLTKIDIYSFEANRDCKQSYKRSEDVTYEHVTCSRQIIQGSIVVSCEQFCRKKLCNSKSFWSLFQDALSKKLTHSICVHCEHRRSNECTGPKLADNSGHQKVFCDKGLCYSRLKLWRNKQGFVERGCFSVRWNRESTNRWNWANKYSGMSGTMGFGKEYLKNGERIFYYNFCNPEISFYYSGLANPCNSDVELNPTEKQVLDPRRHSKVVLPDMGKMSKIACVYCYESYLYKDKNRGSCYHGTPMHTSFDEILCNGRCVFYFQPYRERVLLVRGCDDPDDNMPPLGGFDERIEDYLYKLPKEVRIIQHGCLSNSTICTSKCKLEYNFCNSMKILDHVFKDIAKKRTIEKRKNRFLSDPRFSHRWKSKTTPRPTSKQPVSYGKVVITRGFTTPDDTNYAQDDKKVKEKEDKDLQTKIVDYLKGLLEMKTEDLPVIAAIGVAVVIICYVAYSWNCSQEEDEDADSAAADDSKSARSHRARSGISRHGSSRHGSSRPALSRHATYRSGGLTANPSRHGSYRGPSVHGSLHEPRLEAGLGSRQGSRGASRHQGFQVPAESMLEPSMMGLDEHLMQIPSMPIDMYSRYNV